MDKSKANFEACLDSIEKKLHTTPVCVQVPLGAEKNFIGCVDLINMKKLVFDKFKDDSARTFKVISLDKTDESYEMALKKRLACIERLAQASDEFAEILLERYNLNFEKMTDNILLETYLRKACIGGLITPVLCGSSLRNIGVQPLMDAIIKYLPSPSELKRNNLERRYGNRLVAICFKIIHDHQKSRKRVDSETSVASLQSSSASGLNKMKMSEVNEDILSFVRVYNGELVTRAKVTNPNKGVREVIEKIYIPYSNQLKQVAKVTAGNIAVVNGLVNVNYQKNLKFCFGNIKF
jgi:elongation factor G